MWTESLHLFELVSDSLGLLVPLEPHHVLGVKPPWLFLQSLGRQVLSLGALRGKDEYTIKFTSFWLLRVIVRMTVSKHGSVCVCVWLLPPGSRRWKRVFLWTVSGRTLWSQSGAVVSDDGRARWDTDSSSGIALRTEADRYKYITNNSHHKVAQLMKKTRSKHMRALEYSEL